MALLDLSWMAEFSLLTVTCDVEKIFSLLFKVFLIKFIKEVFVLNNECDIIYVGYWVALLNSVLKIEIAVKCVNFSGRG